MNEFAQARRTMVDCQVRPFDVTDRAVIAAFESVPRERFVPQDSHAFAYGDRVLAVSPDPAGEPRLLLQPMVLARLLQELAIGSGESVLDVGPGLGYSSAVLVAMGARVTALEEPAFAEALRERLLGTDGVRVASGPLPDGREKDGPFDAILINGAVEARPERLVGQLADGGRLACLQGGGRSAKGMIYTRTAGATGFRSLFEAAMRPLGAFQPAPAFVF